MPHATRHIHLSPNTTLTNAHSRHHLAAASRHELEQSPLLVLVHRLLQDFRNRASLLRVDGELALVALRLVLGREDDNRVGCVQVSSVAALHHRTVPTANDNVGRVRVILLHEALVHLHGFLAGGRDGVVGEAAGKHRLGEVLCKRRGDNLGAETLTLVSKSQESKSVVSQ